MTHDEMIAVIQAHKEGKTIQFKWRLGDIWEDFDGNMPSWNFPEGEYRIKPEPIELWAVVYPAIRVELFATKEKAENNCPPAARVAKFREVVDEKPPAREQEAEPTGSERYRVEKTISGFWPYCIKAGDGERILYLGHKKACDRVAAELACAFEDGKFVAKRSLQEHQAQVRTSEWLPVKAESMQLGMLYIWVLPHSGRTEEKVVWLQHEEGEGFMLREFDDTWFFEDELNGYLLETGLRKPT